MFLKHFLFFPHRPRRPEHPLHRRVRRWKDREHQEGDPVPGLRGGVQAQGRYAHTLRGKKEQQQQQ